MARQMKDSGIEWIGEIPESWELQKGKYLYRQRSEKGNSIELQLLSPTQKYGVIPQSLYEKISGKENGNGTCYLALRCHLFLCVCYPTA